MHVRPESDRGVMCDSRSTDAHLKFLALLVRLEVQLAGAALVVVTVQACMTSAAVLAEVAHISAQHCMIDATLHTPVTTMHGT